MAYCTKKGWAFGLRYRIRRATGLKIWPMSDRYRPWWMMCVLRLYPQRLTMVGTVIGSGKVVSRRVFGWLCKYSHLVDCWPVNQRNIWHLTAQENEKDGDKKIELLLEIKSDYVYVWGTHKVQVQESTRNLCVCAGVCVCVCDGCKVVTELQNCLSITLESRLHRPF